MRRVARLTPSSTLRPSTINQAVRASQPTTLSDDAQEAANERRTHGFVHLEQPPGLVDADPRTPLLWAIRDHVGLTGTKYGCGAGLCGACTIHVDGAAQRSCQLDV